MGLPHNTGVFTMETYYIINRLKNQMDLYYSRSITLRMEYYAISITIIVINALIPVFSITLDVGVLSKYLVTIFSELAAVLSSILLLRKTKDTWLEHQSIYAKLRQEQVLFETKSGKNETATVQDFVKACEEIIQNEQNLWNVLKEGMAGK